MLPTQILENEHRIIEQVLSCLSKMVLDVTKDGKFDKEMASDAVDFFRNFADKCHHGKEEVHLFPMIEARQMPGSCGPTNVMRMEHDLGREHVRGMTDGIEAASKGDEDAIRSWTNHAKQFIMLLRDHIMKEDQILYPMANQYFTDDDQAELSAKFEKVEEEEMGEGTHEKYIGIANRLAEKYGVKICPEADTSHQAHHCCGH